VETLRVYDSDGIHYVEERRGDGSIWQRSYWKNGALSSEGQLGNGDHVGLWRYWGDDGIMAARILYGPDGSRVRGEAWYRDGAKQLVENYKDGKKDGQCCVWKPDGTLDLEKSGQYEGGKRVSPCEVQDCERIAPVPDQRK
jgi:antitoxin component YwqK of YwqJK toxin-antitoxin module